MSNELVLKCRDGKRKLSKERCEACGSGPCWGHDCELGNMFSCHDFMGFTAPEKVKGGWIVKALRE